MSRHTVRSRTAVRTLAALALLLVGMSPLAAQSPRPIRALYITGGGFHDFPAQEKIVPPGIAARTNIEWTIDNSAGDKTDVLIDRHKDTAWADQFDVVVYNMSFSTWWTCPGSSGWSPPIATRGYPR
jgi:hypothetical protein